MCKSYFKSEVYSPQNTSINVLCLKGWGKTGAEESTSDVLMEIDVKILPYIKCKVKFPLMYSPLPWKDNQICTGAKGRGACQVNRFRVCSNIFLNINYCQI